MYRCFLPFMHYNINIVTFNNNIFRIPPYLNDSSYKLLTKTTPIRSMESVIKAADFAAIKHKDQRRKSKSAVPYINHPIGVAKILTSEAKVTDPIVLQAALLHDTVEDTDTTIEEIGDVFGDKVQSIVAEVTDDKSLPKQTRKQLQIDNAHKKSPEAKLVKLADKLYNLRDLDGPDGPPVGWDQSRVEEYFLWAFNVVRGLRGSNACMESELDKLFKRHGIIA